MGKLDRRTEVSHSLLIKINWAAHSKTSLSLHSTYFNTFLLSFLTELAWVLVVKWENYRCEMSLHYLGVCCLTHQAKQQIWSYDAV